MTATVNFVVYTGVAPGSGSTQTGIRLKSADDDDTSTILYPVRIPDAGTNYSYVVSSKINVSVAPDTSITNMQLYTDGTGFGTGITLNIGDQYPVTYVQATGTPGVTGTKMTTVYNGVITSVTDLFSYTSGSPLTLTMIKNSGTGDYTNFICIQAYIGTTATKGAKSSKNITLQYDEV